MIFQAGDLQNRILLPPPKVHLPPHRKETISPGSFTKALHDEITIHQLHFTGIDGGNASLNLLFPTCLVFFGTWRPVQRSFLQALKQFARELGP
jgi:hypothetical protein